MKGKPAASDADDVADVGQVVVETSQSDADHRPLIPRRRLGDLRVAIRVVMSGAGIAISRMELRFRGARASYNT